MNLGVLRGVFVSYMAGRLGSVLEVTGRLLFRLEDGSAGSDEFGDRAFCVVGVGTGMGIV
jgi:hypothetical protein